MGIGDNVKCLNGDIDSQRHAGECGVITGFARFSSYHPREAMVQFQGGSGKWFWLYDLEQIS